MWLTRAVRCFTRRARMDRRADSSCWATVLTGTNRMFGRPIASQMASASRPSFFWVLTYGFTYLACISLTVCPIFSNSRAQWCTPPHASIPMVQGESFEIVSRSRARVTVFWRTVRLRSSTPWRAKTDFAMSMPSVVTFMVVPSRWM